MNANISTLVQTKVWKSFMSKVYGWGASIVLIGAMFKIMHWPYSGCFLVIGLSTEAFIFFFSAFEPLHVEYDWTLAYPELMGLDMEEDRKSDKKGALARLQDLFEGSDISPGIFEGLREGIDSLKRTALQLGDISNAVVATNDYVTNINTASDMINSFSSAYNDTIEALNRSAYTLSESYNKTSEMVNTAANGFAIKVSRSSEEIEELLAGSKENARIYAEQFDSMAKNMKMLNHTYSLQLESTNRHIKDSEDLYKDLNRMLENMRTSSEDSEGYKDEMVKMRNNLTALNRMYSNMLTAMNINKMSV